MNQPTQQNYTMKTKIGMSKYNMNIMIEIVKNYGS